MFNSFDIGRLEHHEIKLRRTDLSTNWSLDGDEWDLYTQINTLRINYIMQAYAFMKVFNLSQVTTATMENLFISYLNN